MKKVFASFTIIVLLISGCATMNKSNQDIEQNVLNLPINNSNASIVEDLSSSDEPLISSETSLFSSSIEESKPQDISLKRLTDNLIQDESIKEKSYLIHSQDEFNAYLGNLSSNEKYSLNSDLMKIYNALSTLFFLENNLLITCKIEVPWGGEYVFKNIELVEDSIIINYTYNGEISMYMGMISMFDVFSVSKNASIASIDVVTYTEADGNISHKTTL